MFRSLRLALLPGHTNLESQSGGSLDVMVGDCILGTAKEARRKDAFVNEIAFRTATMFD
jgi:hypothetical protein